VIPDIAPSEYVAQRKAEASKGSRNTSTEDAQDQDYLKEFLSLNKSLASGSRLRRDLVAEYIDRRRAGMNSNQAFNTLLKSFGR
jgi:hypothetical protein